MLTSADTKLDFETIQRAMKACRQNASQTIWEHGEAVATAFLDLHQHLVTGRPLQRAWRLPDWVQPSLLASLPSLFQLQTYQQWHDCGKPFCRTVDADGRQHFPDHAAVSERIWLDAGGDPAIGRLIGMDMDAHLLKADGVPEFAARPEAVALLLTGLAEIHANADMFGGIESTSFKIKWKALDKNGRRVLAHMALSGMAPHFQLPDVYSPRVGNGGWDADEMER